MDAVIYTRVSRADDRGDGRSSGRSVQDQERECRQECERRGWKVREVYCDDGIGASRYSGERPQWRKLKSDLRRGEILVLWEASRAQRDLQEFVELRNQCAELKVLVSYSGRLLDCAEGEDRYYGGMDALNAERESEMIRMRVLRGKRAAAAEGRPPGKAAWGYRNTEELDSGGRKRPQWEPDPLEAPRVREAVERLLAGETQYSVLEWLRSTDGYAPSSPTTLRRALLNPALAGLRVHQGKVEGKATWEPIITRKQHNQLIGRSKRMTELYGFNSQPGPEPKHLLTGIAKCEVCKEGMRYRAKEGRKPYYSCQQGHVARLVEMLDKAVESALFRRLEDVDPSDYDSNGVDDEVIQAEIDELERQIAEWEAEAVAGRVSPSSFGNIEKGIRAQIEALEARRGGPTDLVFDATLWPDLTMTERRQIIRAHLEVIVPKLAKRVRALPGDVKITPL